MSPSTSEFQWNTNEYCTLSHLIIQLFGRHMVEKSCLAKSCCTALKISCAIKHVIIFPHTSTECRISKRTRGSQMHCDRLKQWTNSLLNCNCKCYLHPYNIIFFSPHLGWISNGNIFNVKWRLVSAEAFICIRVFTKRFLHDGKSSNEHFPASIPQIGLPFFLIPQLHNFSLAKLNRGKFLLIFGFLFLRVRFVIIPVGSRNGSKHGQKFILSLNCAEISWNKICDWFDYLKLIGFVYRIITKSSSMLLSMHFHFHR